MPIASIVPLDSNEQSTSQPIQQNTQVQEEPGLLSRMGKQALRVGAGTLARIPELAGAPGSLLQAYGDYIKSSLNPEGKTEPYKMGLIGLLPELSKQLPNVSDIHSAVGSAAEKAGLPAGYLEPQGLAEEVIQSIGSDLPMIIWGGGGKMLGRLVQSLGSSLGMIGARELGAGTTGQFIGGLAGGALPSYALHGGLATPPKMKNGKEVARPFDIKNLRDFAEEQRKGLYIEARKEAPRSMQMDALNLGRNVDEAVEQASRTLPFELYEKFKKNTDSIKLSVFNDQIPVAELLDARQKFNRLVKDTGHDALRGYYERIAKNIREEVNIAKEKFPAFGKKLSPADELSAALGNQSKLREKLESATDLSIENLAKNKLTKMLLLGGSVGSGFKAGGLPGALALGTTTAAGAYSLRGLSRIIDLVSGSPVIQRHLMEIGKNVAKDQWKALPSNIVKLDKAITKKAGSGNFSVEPLHD